jgi:hypothetical protein
MAMSSGTWPQLAAIIRACRSIHRRVPALNARHHVVQALLTVRELNDAIDPGHFGGERARSPGS